MHAICRAPEGSSCACYVTRGKKVTRLWQLWPSYIWHRLVGIHHHIALTFSITDSKIVLFISIVSSLSIQSIRVTRQLT
jgi:hypothetical protein